METTQKLTIIRLNGGQDASIAKIMEIGFAAQSNPIKGQITISVYGRLNAPFGNGVDEKTVTLSVADPKQTVALAINPKSTNPAFNSSAAYNVELTLIPMNPDNILLVSAVGTAIQYLDGIEIARCYFDSIVDYKNENPAS